ncbi:Acyl-CoA synthetase (AMP-forming)/AMP-acid ligase II [Paenibacillus catalpae]|uniref:Acyl-CoA synthetase (AMP-forming)/AMP-acid ligase II n=1 Tax=Paenibacillus catalpae TaxID=1045775 RepID=A0A1I2DNC2_9BACL|nr:AMP-binding protein [Paenibacillus catalpae]SFE81909.1 Acyl-CoA synthetase (AMP-forming)/AMP-acid ligase II [Paenibacillus catalpae]
MKLLKLIYVLYKIRLLSPVVLFRLSAAIYQYGINLMALLRFSARIHGGKTAIVDERETLTYHELLVQSKALSAVLRDKYQLAGGKKAGVWCKNHASLVRAIFAISWAGADLYLLNAEMSGEQLNNILETNDFDLLIYDVERSALLERSTYPKTKILSDQETLSIISNAQHKKQKRHWSSSGKLVLLTGGTTGKGKKASHKPSLFNYLDPFFAFLTRLQILNYRNAYIATPIYHGYGIAVLLLFCALGKKVILHRGFDPEKACRIIREHQVEVVTVVPLMLHKMLKTNAEDLKSLSCIASGGAELSPKLAKESLEQLGEVLYNLYGTSETGLNMIATARDLTQFPSTIGKKINGGRIKIVDDQKREVEIGRVGQLCVKNRWSMRNRTEAWIETGDLGYRNEQGYYFLSGRADSMIVSAGENVYPYEVEHVLLTHPQVEDAAVIVIQDEYFGQRLKAIVVLVPQTETSKEELHQWLQARLARFQMPKEIVFVNHLPYTHLGKLDRKLLT